MYGSGDANIEVCMYMYTRIHFFVCFTSGHTSIERFMGSIYDFLCCGLLHCFSGPTYIVSTLGVLSVIFILLNIFPWALACWTNLVIWALSLTCWTFVFRI